MFFSESKQRWIERVQSPDGKVHQISGKTKNQLAKKLSAYNLAERNGKTFSEYADEWEVFREGRIEETTAQSYSAHIKRAKDYFDGKYIKDITPDEVQSFVDYLVDMNYAKDTVRRGLVVVNKIFKYAITRPNSEVKYNPCIAVEIPRGLRQTQREPPTEDQILKIENDTQSQMGLFAHFILYTGVRPEELLALDYEDIDRENKKIRIDKVVTYPTNHAVLKRRTKTDAGTRDVILLDALESILPDKKKGLIFGQDGKYYDKGAFYREWTRWCESVGLAEVTYEEHINPKNKHKYRKKIVKRLITPYQFRHEFASVLEDEGVSEFDAQHLMGHSSINVTKDKYTHFRDKKNKQLDAKEKLNKRFVSVTKK